jgi:hypothetical protein
MIEISEEEMAKLAIDLPDWLYKDIQERYKAARQNPNTVYREIDGYETQESFEAGGMAFKIGGVPESISDAEARFSFNRKLQELAVGKSSGIWKSSMEKFKSFGQQSDDLGDKITFYLPPRLNGDGDSK